MTDMWITVDKLLWIPSCQPPLKITSEIENRSKALWSKRPFSPWYFPANTSIEEFPQPIRGGSCICILSGVSSCVNPSTPKPLLSTCAHLTCTPNKTSSSKILMGVHRMMIYIYLHIYNPFFYSLVLFTFLSSKWGPSSCLPGVFPCSWGSDRCVPLVLRVRWGCSPRLTLSLGRGDCRLLPPD